MEGNYSIRDLEKLSGVKAHTIRMWEKRYDLFNPDRTDTNIRTYSPADLRKMLNIAILSKNGYKISKIAALKEDALNKEVLRCTSCEESTLIEELILSMINMDEDRFVAQFEHSIRSRGLENTIREVIYPFMERIGVLWLTGTINPAQEHFVSNIIRQKLIRAIDDLGTTVTRDEKFLLFLPPDEMHELGLLFYTYLIREKGFKTIYLGQNVPYEDLRTVASIMRPEFVVTSIIAPLTDEQIDEFITSMSEDLPDCMIFVSGLQMEDRGELSKSNLRVMQRADELVTYLDNL